MSHHQVAKLQPLRTVILLVAFAGLAGCVGARHSTSGFLLKETGDDDVFTLARDLNGDLVSNNPIYVETGSIFTISLESVNPGWIHFDKKFSPGPLDENKWTKQETDHIRGKELWVLFTITALDRNDPLELKRKEFFHATNVKFGTESFRGIPLDISEKNVFSHEADAPYRVRYRVYEVDNFDLKRAAVDAFSEDPGLYGVGVSLFNSIRSTVSSIIGDDLTKLVKNEDEDETLLLERLLLSQGGEIELAGEFLIIRAERLTDKNSNTSSKPIDAALESHHPTIKLADAQDPHEFLTGDMVAEYAQSDALLPTNLLTEEYLLYDYFKSHQSNPAKFDKNIGEYQTLQDSIKSQLTKLRVGAVATESYIRISVAQAKKLESGEDVEGLASLAETENCNEAKWADADEEQRKETVDCMVRIAAANKVRVHLTQTLD